MNATAKQLNDRYPTKLVWITMTDGSIITGQFAGQDYLVSDELQNISVWLIENLSAFFIKKSDVPIRHHSVHPSQIVGIEVLDWGKPGGAQQLYELCALRCIKVKTASGDAVFGVARGFKPSEDPSSPIDEQVLIYEVQSPKECLSYIGEITGENSKTRLIHLREVFLSEIVGFEIVRAS